MQAFDEFHALKILAGRPCVDRLVKTPICVAFSGYIFCPREDEDFQLSEHLPPEHFLHPEAVFRWV